jgi:hypothetical protein
MPRTKRWSMSLIGDIKATTMTTTTTRTFEPGEVRYIKLGDSGRWAADAIETGIIGGLNGWTQHSNL